MTRKTSIRAALSAIALFAALIPQAAMSASTFYGIVRHVAVNAIKVYDPHTKQTLGFEILPKFDQVFSSDGKTTYQMSKVKPGQYVGIIYDQKALGIRHADKIYLMNDANQRLGRQ